MPSHLVHLIVAWKIHLEVVQVTAGKGSGADWYVTCIVTNKQTNKHGSFDLAHYCAERVTVNTGR